MNELTNKVLALPDHACPGRMNEETNKVPRPGRGFSSFIRFFVAGSEVADEFSANRLKELIIPKLG